MPRAPAVAVALVAIWLLVDPRTPDLAAQVYRVELFNHLGFAVWDLRWYGGHPLPGYSLLFPAFAALVGMRTVAALSVVASAVLGERLLLAIFGEAGRWGAVWFAVAALADVWIGRLTFALGVTFALAGYLALLRGRPAVAGVAAVLCAAASPVAGVLLALTAITQAFLQRSSRAALALAAPALVCVVLLAALFPEGGWEPYPLTSFLATLAVVLGVLWALPAGWPGLRLGALLYLGVCLASVALHTPMGANVERYGLLLGGPLLLCALCSAPLGRRAPAAVLVLCALAVWTLWGPVRETAAVAGDSATGAAYYAPVKRYLATQGGELERVEVPFTRSHWEAAWLAPAVSLARGWEKQLDTRYDEVLLRPGLTAAAYLAWLRRQAVAYVALPDAPLDPSSAQEGRLIRGGLPYLREVFASAHWRIYRVLGATPLVQGPGRLAALGHDSFAIDASAAGAFVVRVHYTRYWTVTHGSACVAAAPAGWTSLLARRAGTIVIAARFSLGRALGLGGASCGAGASGSISAGLGVPGSFSVGSGSSAGQIGGRSSTPQSTTDYRWFIPLRGSSSPSIAQENSAAGTLAWRLPGPTTLLGGEGRGPVEGYVSQQSILPGQTQRIYVNAPGARTVTVQIFRMGYYHGTGGRLVLQSRPLLARRQPSCTHRSLTGLTECRWRATITIPLPQTLTSGVYTVKLTTSGGAQRDCLFIVRSASPQPLLVQIPTATYEAYNDWGGDSLYPGGTRRVGLTGTDQGVEVSYDRPYGSQTGAGQFFVREVALVRFLERHGYPVSYTAGDSLEEDPAQLRGVKAVLDAGHSEYWSADQERALREALARGTSLLFLSSDTLAWRVRFGAATDASSEAGRPAHTIIAYKQFVARDPDRREPSGLFPLGGAALTGSAYNGCITPRLSEPGPPVYRYYAWRPAAALRPAWLFAHSGVHADTVIAGIVGYELDERTSAAPAGTQVVGAGTQVSCQSESEPSPVHGHVAQSTLYGAPSGAFVFASGTLGWIYGLSPVPQASPDVPRVPDPRVVAMTENLLARALGRGSTPAG